MLWLALPPVGLAPLAWLAPIPWLLLVRRRELPGRRSYVALWVAGFGFWMATLHWLRLPHPATSIGWVALSFYLAFYLPAFVAASRVAVHQLRVPLIAAAPIAWTGLEFVRGHLLTGFTMASLGHSQYRWLELIQIADLAGAYGVGFVVMFAAACLASMPPVNNRPWRLGPLLPLGAAALLVGGYGVMRLRAAPAESTPAGPAIALIQGSIDTEMKADERERMQVYEEYLALSRQALDGRDDVAAIVWPETMFRMPLLVLSADTRPAPDDEWTVAMLGERARDHRQWIRATAQSLGTPMVLGIDVFDFGPGVVDHYNSALHVDAEGEIMGRYDKMHPVMFGEYIPFGKTLPWLYRLTPLGAGLTEGTEAAAFDIGGLRFAPSICYETVLPHVIRRQVGELTRQGQEPDVLLNLTNDGWFWGSSELDLHLICGVFRAVECRKPLLIAANTGFSAWIDGDGRILKQGRRRDRDVIIARPTADGRRSPYLGYGDWPAGVCLAATIGFALVGVVNRRRQAPRQAPRQASPA